MVELLGEWALNGKIRYTAANKGWPLSPRKYTIKKYKYKTKITRIEFYDTVSMSYHFGFEIHQYKDNWIMFFIHPGGVRDNTLIKVEGYKEIIQVLKEQKFANFPIR